MMVKIQELMELVQSQEGNEYIFGVEDSPDNPNPDAFDCSELVQWACDRMGVDPKMPDGSGAQYHHCKENDTLIPVDDGLNTYGALLFVIGIHVGFSLGNGKVFQALGKKHGVGSFPASWCKWNAAGLIPGVDYGEE